jgi:structural maintenance of chromosome 3 (chondroitin sulfate proteoglycan 6)
VVVGDKRDRKGTLSGGYHNQRRSRLEAVYEMKRWRNKLTETEQQLEALRKELDHILS